MRALTGTAFLILCLFSSTLSGAAELRGSEWEIQTSRDGVIEYRGRIDLIDAVPTIINESIGDRVEMGECEFIAEPGNPVLPAYQVKIAVPDGMIATGLRVVTDQGTLLDGRFSIQHAQPENRISADASELELIDRNPEVYETDDLWPETAASLVGVADLAGQSMAVVEIYPLAYAPVSGSMILYSGIELVLTCEAGGELGDYAPDNLSLMKADAYTSRLQEMVINPDQISLVSNTFRRSPSTLDPGEFDMVVIYPAGWNASYEPWVAWKTQTGIPTNMVMDYWIYNDGGYTGSNEEKIRQFIIDAHQTWGTDNFLIGADTNKIPCQWTLIDDNIPNDTWYSDFDDDWVLEVNVGRIPARYSYEALTFLANSMDYEKNPPLTDFCHTALFLGFDLDGDTEGEDAMEFIDTSYFDEDWTIYKVYDSHGGNHKDYALAAMDDGYNLINHIDHSETTEMGLGSQHNYWLYQLNVNALTNAEQRSLVYSLGCYANNYENYECIAETWVKADDGGAVAFIGNSRYGWYNPGLTNTLSFIYDRYFFRSLLDQGHTRLGDAFTDHKNDRYPSGGQYPYIWTELTLLGDPQLLIWTDDPIQIQTSYPAVVQTGSSSLAVLVQDGGGADLAGASVCLYKEGEVYETISTGGDGTATFDISAATDGEMMVTVTGQNMLPHEGTVMFVPYSDTADDQITPLKLALETGRNPFVTSAQLSYQIPAASAVELTVFDLAGRRVRTLVNSGQVTPGAYTTTWDGRDDGGHRVASGIYLYRLVTDRDRVTKRAVVIHQ